MNKSPEGPGPISEANEADPMVEYAERIRGMSDVDLFMERNRHRWAVPNRAPSFYKEDDLYRQSSASAEELKRAREEGKAIEDEISRRGLTADI